MNRQWVSSILQKVVSTSPCPSYLNILVSEANQDFSNEDSFLLDETTSMTCKELSLQGFNLQPPY